MTTMRQAHDAMTAIARVQHADPDGTRTIEGAKRAYVRGTIEVDELERRLDKLMGIAPERTETQTQAAAHLAQLDALRSELHALQALLRTRR
jgi:hypothetical protein